MQCPKCGGTLNAVKVTKRPEYGGSVLDDAEKTREIEVDQCLSCNGVYFDANELNQYLDEKLFILDSPPVPESAVLNRKEGTCPRCNQAMVRKPAPNNARFTIDVCEACNGVWLDSTELDKLEDKNTSFATKNILVYHFLKDLFKKRNSR